MSDWETLKEKGNEEFKKKNYNTAINLYTDAIKLNDNEETLYGNRALCLKGIGKTKQAIYDMDKALKINPKNTKYLKRLAQLHISIGNLGDALMLLQKCLNLEPRDLSHSTEFNKIKELNKNYESLLEAKQKFDWVKCEELAEKLIKECTDFSNLKLIYIESLLNNVKISEAIEYLINKVTQDEKYSNEEFDYLLVLALYYDGKYEKAKKLLASLLQRSEDSEKLKKLWIILKDIEKLKEKANETFKNGRYQEAIDQYTQLLELDENNRNFNSIIYSNRALCYQKLNNHMEALKDVNKSISLNDKYMKAYVRRGNIYMALKMYEEARYDFQKVKEAEPNNRDIVKLLEDAKKEEKIAKKRDYYKILDLKSDANENDIRKSYKKLALKWHPDRNNGSEEQKKMAEKTFRDINDAYTVLSDPQKKQQYDAGIDPLNPEEAQGMNGGMHFGGGGVNPEDILKMFMGGGGSSFFSNMGGQRSSGGFGDTGGFHFSFGGNQGGDFEGFSGFPGGFSGFPGAGFSTGGQRQSYQKKNSKK